jgi:hypothetical protein
LSEKIEQERKAITTCNKISVLNQLYHCTCDKVITSAVWLSVVPVDNLITGVVDTGEKFFVFFL